MNPLNLIANTLIVAVTQNQQQPLAPPAAEQYNALVQLLADRQIDLTRVIDKPESTRGRDYLLEDLTDANADQDADLLAATLTLLGALHDQTDAASTLPQSIGVDLDNIVAAGLNIYDVVSDDLGVRIRNSKFLGTMHIGQVVAGDKKDTPNEKAGNIEVSGNSANEIHVGDKINDDKVGGDKVYGDKNVFVNTSPLDLTELESNYLQKLDAECNELLLANDGPVDLTQKRQPRMQRVYVDLDTTATVETELLRERLMRLNVSLNKLFERLNEHAETEKQEGRTSRLADMKFGKGQYSLDDPHLINPTPDFLRMFDDELIADIADKFSTTPEDLHDAFANPTILETIQSNPQLVILGDPGGGKSTLTRRLAGVLASECRDDLDETEAQWLAELDAIFGRRLLPVRVVMSRWAAKLAENATGCAADLVAECLRIQRQIAELSDSRQEVHFTARLTGDEPTALILLDGLDEVSDTTRRAKLLAAVRDFCHGFKNMPLIVTCRIRPYEAWTQSGEALPLPTFTLAGLSHAAITDFINRWHEELLWSGRYQPDASKTAKSRLLNAIDDAHRQELHEMAETPLLLTMMARVNYSKGLSNSRAMLYEEYVEQLLWEWERTKLDDLGEPTSLETLLNKAGVPRGSLEKALDRLAYDFHDPVSHDDTVDIPKHAVRDKIEFIHSTEAEKEAARAAWAVSVLRIMDDRSGLLYSKDHETYHFSHRTFQEYLAARQIAAGEFITKFEARIDIEAWREAIFLALGYQIAVRSEYDSALAVFDELLPTDPQTGEEWRRITLLGDAYTHLFGPRLARQAEQKKRAERVIRTIPNLLTQTMQNPALPPQQRLEAGKLLADLQIDPPDLDAFIAIPGQPFRIGKYPVTNRQFGRFMQAGGYQNDNWWQDEKGRKYRDDERWTEPRYWDDVRFNWLTQPVVGISWYEADAYCAWLTVQLQKKEEIGEDELVSLPTEAEWMAAARADEAEYPWGKNEFDAANANTKESGLGQTTPVHMYTAGQTADEVWDLSGNVYEWILEEPGELKGGCWGLSASEATSSARNWHLPNDGDGGLGFRLSVVPLSLRS